MNSLKNNHFGFSLVSTLVAAGIMGILLVIFMTMIEVQNKELRSVKQKISVLSLNQLLLRVVQNPKNCSCHLDSTLNTVAPGPLTINTTVPYSPEINLQSFRNGCDFSTTDNILVEEGSGLLNSSGLKVSSVKITDITPTGTINEFSGKLVVDYDASTLSRNLAPVSIGLIFKVDSSTGTPSARPIISCTSGSTTRIQAVETAILVTTTGGNVDCATVGEVKTSDSMTYIPKGDQLIIEASSLITAGNDCGMQLDLSVVGPGLNKRFRIGYLGKNTTSVGSIAATVSNQFVVEVVPGASYTVNGIFFVKSNVMPGGNGNIVDNTTVVITDIIK